MWKPTVFSFFAAAAVAALLGGCAGSAPPKDDQSGYLGNYSNLKETTGAGGARFYRYVSSRFTPANYDAVIVKEVQFYPPNPQPTDKVSAETLQQIRDYLSTTLREKIGEKVRVVNTPGRGVCTVNVAITAVAGEEEGIKPYQVLPVAFVATMAYRGVAGTPEDARILVEAKVVDSLSGDVLLKSVRAGTGEQLKKNLAGQREVTLAAVKPVIDRWGEEVAVTAAKFIRAK
jgi:hypothetical protein